MMYVHLVGLWKENKTLDTFYSFKDEAQTALFEDPVRTAL